MSKFKVGDKVIVLDVNYPMMVFGIEVGDEVEVVEIENLKCIGVRNNNAKFQIISPEQVELVSRKVCSNFKIGDKVRLNTKLETNDYFIITDTMIDDYDVLTISWIGNNYYSGETEIKVRENGYSYHPSWLELVEEKEELEVEKVEEIGYTIITGYHFGSSHKYSWLCDRELYNNIKLNDLVLVETKLGEQVVQVIEKSNVIDKQYIHKNVIKKLEITSK